MKIALIGATGFIGSAILQEALNRGHQVTGIMRHPEKLPQHSNLIPRQGDVMDRAQVPELVAGHDAVISAYGPGRDVANVYQQLLSAYQTIIDGVKRSGVKRLLVVGGAGSLEVSPGVQLLDTSEFPEAWKASARAGRDVLNLLRDESELEWTYLSPSMMIVPGERTGQFRLGADQILRDAEGESHISAEDYAVAMVDELEEPRHIRRRFTVGY
jgi:putative NADH-flavin reductase